MLRVSPASVVSFFRSGQACFVGSSEATLNRRLVAVLAERAPGLLGLAVRSQKNHVVPQEPHERQHVKLDGVHCLPLVEMRYTSIHLLCLSVTLLTYSQAHSAVGEIDPLKSL